MLVVLGCCFEPGFPAPSGALLAFNVAEPPAGAGVVGVAEFREQPVFASIPGKTGHHAASVLAFDSGELLAAWYSYAGPGELDGSGIYLARRPAGEEVWQTPLAHREDSIGNGNPVLYHEGDEVWLFQAVVPFGWSTSHIEVQRSHDRGLTWTEPALIDGPLGTNVRNPPIRTVEGELLLPAYDDLIPRSLFFASQDGESWRLRSAVFTDGPHFNIQPSVVKLGDGRLLACMRNAGGGWLWAMASDDHGRSWSLPIDTGFTNPGSAALLLRLTSGNLVLVFNDDPSVRRPLSISLSTDEGRSWSKPKPLVEGDGSYSYPAAIQAHDGIVHVLYTRDRQSINHVSLNEAWILEP
ncbi:MAG: sialidase family protein [Planctomycetota bacterium]